LGRGRGRRREKGRRVRDGRFGRFGRSGGGWSVWDGMAGVVGEDRMKGWESGGVGCVRVWSRCWCI